VHCVPSQKRQFAAGAQDRHQPQVRSDRRGGVAGLHCPQSIARDSNAFRHLGSVDAPRFAKPLEAVAQLQQQLALQEVVHFRDRCMVKILTINSLFGYLFDQIDQAFH
jgi:hypothetical protein